MVGDPLFSFYSLDFYFSIFRTDLLFAILCMSLRVMLTDCLPYPLLISSYSKILQIKLLIQKNFNLRVYFCCCLPCLFLSVQFNFDTINNVLEHIEDSCFGLFSLLLLSLDVFVDGTKLKSDGLHKTLIVFFSFGLF